LDAIGNDDEPAPEPPAAPPLAEPAVAAVAPEALLSSGAGAQVSSAFNMLASTVLSSNARTLEDLVKEMLRPMLKAWLDDNLPPLVEKLVRAEIERVARGIR
jgi:cell pole-organizing protein PopZ